MGCGGFGLERCEIQKAGEAFEAGLAGDPAGDGAAGMAAHAIGENGNETGRVV